MKYISITKKLLLLLFVFCGMTAQATEWRRIFFLDFGGNSESDPVFRTEGLSGDEGSTEMKFSPTITKTNKYCIAKYAENNINGWLFGGDHTHADNKNEGYFLMVDCEKRDDMLTMFDKTLTSGLCTGVTFKFEAYVALLTEGDDASGGSSYITLGIYTDNSTTPLWQRDAYPVDVSNDGETALNWQKIEGEFSIPVGTDLSSGIHFKIYPTMSDGTPYSSTGGYDFGLDDIAIYASQPSVSFDKDPSEFLYNEPAKITASIDQTSFFSDYSTVTYCWEYSTDSINWSSDKYTSSYTNSPNYAYSIASFDKDNTTGSGNGYYRLTIGSSNEVITNMSDESACLVRGVYKLEEKTNKVNLVLCAGGSQAIGGKTFKAEDPTPQTYGSYEIKITKIDSIHKDINDVICVGKSYNGTVYSEATTTPEQIGTPTVIKSKRVNYSGEYCDSIVTTTYLTVTDGEKVYHDEDICKGGKSTHTGITYDATGDKIDSITINNDCINDVWYVNVGKTYDDVVEKTICQGESFEGKTYNTGTGTSYETITKKFKTYRFGCDSIMNVHLYVTSHTEAQLDDQTICQSDAGEGKTAFTFNGKNYVNNTTKDMVLDLADTTTSVVTGCDSISKIHVVIKPMIHTYSDTMICRDQKLFGQEWTVAGTYPKNFSYTSVNGCDSIHTWNIKVLDIQLKLRAEFGISSICDGQSATLIVELTPSNVPLTWEPELSSRNPLRPTVMPDETTTFVAHAINEVGCHATDSILISVFPNPTLTIDTVYQQERKLEFTLDGGTPDFTYMIGNKQVEATSDYTIENLTYGTNAFRVTDQNGCTAIDTFSLEPLPVKPSEIISPNGDGIDDYWIIENIDVYPTATVRVFDRFGKLIYEQQGNYENTPFDGRCNGNLLPSTDYWYEIDIDDIDKQYTGHFTLLR